MPQLNKGGKFVFGLSVIRQNLTIHIPPQLCPVCGNKTRNQIREDTVLLNFPLYCPKCKQETLIEAKKLQVTVIEDIDKKRDDKER